MKLFVRFVLGIVAVVIGISLGHSLVGIEASEPDDTKNPDSVADNCQENLDPGDSWADCDTPGYQLFPTRAGHVGVACNLENLNQQGAQSHAMRTLICDHNEAFSRFHKMFQYQFAVEEYDGLSRHSEFRRWKLWDFNQLPYGGNLSWYILEWSGNLSIEPKRSLSDNEFRSVKIDLISKQSPLLRFTKPSASRSMETLGNPEEDFERSIVTTDPVVRMLEASNEQATRTEWKVARFRLINLTQRTSSGSINKHPIITAYERHEASPETLNAFEQRAVAQLESNPVEKVVTASSDREIQVVGPLRAVRHCTKCHQVADGTLLSVFSYRLTRTDPSR